MQTVLYSALALAALVIAGAFAILVSGLLRELKKLGRTCEDLSTLLNTTERELASTTEVVRQTVSDVDGVVVGVSNTMRKVEKVVSGIENIVERAQTITSVAGVVRSSSGGFLSVYEGIKQGIRTLWGLQDTDKEGTANEPR